MVIRHQLIIEDNSASMIIKLMVYKILAPLIRG